MRRRASRDGCAQQCSEGEQRAAHEHAGSHVAHACASNPSRRGRQCLSYERAVNNRLPSQWVLNEKRIEHEDLEVCIYVTALYVTQRIRHIITEEHQGGKPGLSTCNGLNVSMVDDAWFETVRSEFPPVSMGFAYGSAVFAQHGYTEAQRQSAMTDLIFVVDDARA